jgi:glycosyltransferase involved in cell wall biosynthesis
MHVPMTNSNEDRKIQAPILTFRPRVLHIISGDLWAGAEVQAYTLLSALHEHCELLVVLMNQGELADRLAKAGINLNIIDESQTNSLNIFIQLCKTIRGFSPDLIHTHRQKENILGAMANAFAGRFTRKRLWRRCASIRTVHGAPEFASSGFRKIQVWLDRFCGNYQQDAIISVSTDLASKLRGIFLDHKIHIIENGVDLESLQQAIPAKDIRATKPDAYHIGIVGRLEPVKRIDIFLRAARQLLDRTTEPVYFHIIGDGKLADTLKSLSNELNLSAFVKFHGHRTDPAQTIAALDLVVMCSDHEGTPMTALETLALGKPLIAHSVGGLVEVLVDYPELLVTDHNPIAYANKILQVMQDRPKVTLDSRYTQKANGSATLALYRQLIGASVE